MDIMWFFSYSVFRSRLESSLSNSTRRPYRDFAEVVNFLQKNKRVIYLSFNSNMSEWESAMKGKETHISRKRAKNELTFKFVWVYDMYTYSYPTLLTLRYQSRCVLHRAREKGESLKVFIEGKEIIVIVRTFTKNCVVWATTKGQTHRQFLSKQRIFLRLRDRIKMRISSFLALRKLQQQ